MATRGIRNKNPFNIVRSDLNNWLGKVDNLNSTDRTFEQFTLMEYGLRAGMMILAKYITKYNLHDINDIIHKYAPPTENVTWRYISFVEGRLETWTIDKAIDPIAWFLDLCRAICWYESHFDVSTEYLNEINDKYKIFIGYEKRNS